MIQNSSSCNLINPQPTLPMSTPQWRDQLIEVLTDKKAKNPVFFPVTSPFAEWFVVVSATSSRHLWALCQAVEQACKSVGRRAKSQGRHDATEWIVLNTQGIFVHLFLEESRAYYDLETLWKQEESHTFLDPILSDAPPLAHQILQKNCIL